tara:strand:+ start:361 stop:531 length:171 start_codon:yes stop_codon:yes gene_type:complete
MPNINAVRKINTLACKIQNGSSVKEISSFKISNKSIGTKTATRLTKAYKSGRKIKL